ncbi:MAG: hypothetical protein KDB94_09235 [Acidobacteria bacterium]|nr:hypothetical protein [Acidobacteriota bacterium]MCB9377645.1 hypothetical protein [Holophagales bacterium]
MSDRKYQQRGYMQSDDRERRGPREERGPRPPRDPRDAPRGRGLGGPTASVFRCARCGTSQQVAAAAASDAQCTSCGADLHSCTNCLSFDSAAPNQCRVPGVERIARKDQRNDCGSFEPRLRQESTAETEARKSSPGGNDARAAFDALFKI